MKNLKKLDLSSKEELGNAFDSLKMPDAELANVLGGHNGGSCWLCDYHCTSGVNCTSNWCG